MSEPFNIFAILDLPHQERPHDKALAWLLDPKGGHGLESLAAELIRRIWGTSVGEHPTTVTRQKALPGGCRPDIWVEFKLPVLMIENKVAPGALRAGQIAEQNAAAKTLLKDRPLFHLLLHPDRVRTDGLVIEDSTFRQLTYGQLAGILNELAVAMPIGVGRSLLTQFADYIRDRYGQPAPAGIRLASGTALARRYAGGSWSEEEFIEAAEKTCSPDIVLRQRELLDLLRTMEAVEVRFDAQGATNPTYKVYVAGTDIHLLWVYADGRLYPTWKPLRTAGIAGGEDEWKRRWGAAIKAENKNDSFATGGLAVFSVEDVVKKLQAIADYASRGVRGRGEATGTP